MLVYRDYKLTESQDWQMNVHPLLGRYNESVPMYVDGKIMGWKIQSRYE